MPADYKRVGYTKPLQFDSQRQFVVVVVRRKYLKFRPRRKTARRFISRLISMTAVTIRAFSSYGNRDGQSAADFAPYSSLDLRHSTFFKSPSDFGSSRVGRVLICNRRLNLVKSQTAICAAAISQNRHMTGVLV